MCKSAKFTARIAVLSKFRVTPLFEVMTTFVCVQVPGGWGAAVADAWDCDGKGEPLLEADAQRMLVRKLSSRALSLLT